MPIVNLNNSTANGIVQVNHGHLYGWAMAAATNMVVVRPSSWMPACRHPLRPTKTRPCIREPCWLIRHRTLEKAALRDDGLYY
jgi:hypothetical protein